MRQDLLTRVAELPPDALAVLHRRIQRRLGVEGAALGGETSAIERRPSGPGPLSFAQERLWFIDQLQPGTPAYNVPLSLPLPGDLEPATLERALSWVVERHEILRSRFFRQQDEALQHADEPSSVRLPVVDLGRWPQGPPAEWIDGLAGRQLQRSFDLARGPVWRGALLRWGGTAGRRAHLLLLVLHHIVCDAWSLEILRRELSTAYASFQEGEAPDLPPLALQYADYAAWQRQRMTPDRLADQVAYWRRRLEDLPALLELPADRPRPAAGTLRGGLASFSFTAQQASFLKGLGRRGEATLFMVGLAAFAALLYRYTGRRDLVVGTPVAHRDRPELEPLIGFFLNTLPLRLDVEPRADLAAWVVRARETLLEAHAHQEVPFDLLVEQLRPERSASFHPFFQVMFVLQEASRQGAGAALPAAEPSQDIGITDGSSRFDLTLSIAEASLGEDLGLGATVEFSADLFDRATVRRMIHHLRNLLESARAEPRRGVADLDLLSAAERAQLAAWNDTAAAYPSHLTFHGLFETQADRRPDAVAVLFEEQAVSFGELERRANAWAHRLRAAGVGPEARVAICVPRSIEMVVAVLAVLKAGGAYVPLDPDYPRERLRLILRDADARVVLTTAEVADGLPVEERTVLLLDEAPADPPADFSRPSNRVGPDHAAYLIYTSGSTGRPKGVVVRHGGLTNAAAVDVAAMAVTPEDRVLQFASLSFDASVMELLISFWGGATLCLARRHDLLPGAGLETLLRDRRVTIFPVPPSALAAQEVEDLPWLRLFIVMGEACPRELVARWREVAAFFNAYGPTESSMWVVGAYLDGERKPQIGRPIANHRAQILDPRLRRQPLGVPGELCVAGVGLARGYLHRPALTADAFRPDPFAHRPGERLYRTGDLARTLPDGQIDLLGRIDHQVKVRGFRIELGEIEAVLGEHEGVTDAAVLVRTDLAMGKGLVAYVVVATGAEQAAEGAPGVSALRRFAGERLPDYMVPAVFVFLPELPLTGSGKVDRDALPAPQGQRPELEATFVATEGAVEDRLAEIWKELLGLETVGAEDDFFELGGHSLLATQLVSRIRDRLGVEVALQQIFEAPTIQGLAALVETAPAAPRPAAATGGPALAPQAGTDEASPTSGALPSVAAPPADPSAAALLVRLEGMSEDEVERHLQERLPGDRRGLLRALLEAAVARPARVAAAAASAGLPPLERRPAENPRAENSPVESHPVSFAQERLWFLDRLQPGNAGYNIPETLPLPGPLNEEALRRAVAALVTRHAALRTTFGLEEGKPVQRVHARLEIPLRVEDLRSLSEAEGRRRFQELTLGEAQTGFDLEAGPLLRATLVRLGGEIQALLLTLHHIVSDGWSMDVLRRELGELYQAYSAGGSPGLPALPLQYADYARWQRQWLRGDELRRQLDFWRGELEGAPEVLDLPLDRPRPQTRSFQGALRPFALPPAWLEQARQLARDEGATLFMVGMAAFAAFLSRLTGQRRVVIGTPVANRGRSELEGLIGFFVNTLPLSVELGKAQTFRQLVGSLRRTTVAAFGHQDLPFEKLVEVLQPERNLGLNPLFQVMFLLEPGAPDQETPRVESENGLGPEMPAASKFDLSLYLKEVGEGWMGAFEYSVAIFDSPTIARFAAAYRGLLGELLAAPDGPIEAPPLLPPAEAQALLDFNDTATDYGEIVPLHGGFARQAEARPEAEALVFEGESLTYGEVAERVARLAATLRFRGVGAETVVGVALERSFELPIVLHAVLWAGGAYLALDPDLPAERLAFQAADAGAALVITQARLQEDLRDGFETAGQTLLSWETVEDLEIEGGALPEPLEGPAPVDLDQVAYVLYTSGSTGRPKGVMVSHRAIANRLLWMQEQYGLEPEDRVLQKTPFGFDVSVWELFWPLAEGATMVLARPGGHLDSAYLVRLIRREEIAALHFVPSMLQVFAAEEGLEELSSLQQVIASGEALPVELARRVAERLPCPIDNLYGPTEAAVDVTYCRFEDGLHRHAMPIGQAIANLQIHVLDAAGRPTLRGVPGELHIGGVGLARGYLGRPALTAEKFVPDPFSSAPGGRLYRTGDRVRRLADGALHFLERLDYQVKIRGFRIELGEIEAVLEEDAAVREAAVAVQGGGGQVTDPRLVAWVVPVDAEASPEEGGAWIGDLRRRLGERLPGYMVPAAFVELPEMPVTANGKLDRKALPAPSGSRAQLGGELEATRTPLEGAVAGLYAEVLALDEVGRGDDFFDLGGHSLLAVQLLARLRELFQVEVPLPRFFEASQVAALAELLREEAEDGGAVEEIAALIAEVQGLSDDEVARRLAGAGQETQGGR